MRGGGGGGSRGPFFYMKNDIMHAVIYAAFLCIVLAKRSLHVY